MDSLNSLIFCFILIVTNLCTTTISGKCPYQSERIPPPNLQDLGDICTPRSLKCDPNNIYYTLNGSCNNLQHSYWGQFSTPFIRLLKANYADGKCSLRVSVTGKPLPLPRLIRTTVLENKEILDQKYNILFYGFGQWLDHDITFQNTNASNTVKCCKNNRPKAYMDPDICIPQINPRNDSFYSTFGLECLEFTRSINTKMMNCDLKPCAPINMATAYLDLSILYGNNATLAIQLRTLKGGKLKVSNNELTNFQEYPTVTAGTECPFGGLSPQDNSYCFKVGDIRVLQNPELIILEFIFLRLHNYIADGLAKICPRLSDEKLYQQARRILIAIYQAIVFLEHIPLTIGPEATKKYKLYPVPSDYNNGYNESLKAQTILSYEASAGRILHSMIRGDVPYKNSSQKADNYLLRYKYFNQAFFLGKNMFLNLIESFAYQTCDIRDKYFSQEITNYLFASPPKFEYGLDLPTLDILRGRDHGLAVYNDYREYCGLCRLKSFEDLKPEIKDPKDADRLKQVYKSVDDIDSYVGSALEISLPGAVVGPTAACITGEAFYKLKYGDRLYCGFKSAGFTSAQLTFLRNATFAQILCTITPGLEYVPKNAFLVASKANPLVRCDQISRINLALFKNC